MINVLRLLPILAVDSGAHTCEIRNYQGLGTGPAKCKSFFSFHVQILLSYCSVSNLDSTVGGHTTIKPNLARCIVTMMDVGVCC